MIDYSARIGDLCSFLQHTTGIVDREAITLLLASRIESTPGHTPLPYPWFVLETDYYRFDTLTGWFHFGGQHANNIYSLPKLRLGRPDKGNPVLEQLLDERAGWKLFIEPEFKEPNLIHQRFYTWPYLMQSCLRVRTKQPRAGLLTDQDQLQLQRYANLVLDSKFRTNFNILTKYVLGGKWDYWIEVAQKLSGRQRDWIEFKGNLQAITDRLIYLDPEHFTPKYIQRVLSDCVPEWITDMMNTVQTGVDPWRGSRADYRVCRAETHRIKEEGFIVYERAKWKLTELGVQGIRLMRGDYTV